MDANTKALDAPKEYISNLPSKNVRAMLLAALNVWFHLPAAMLAGLTEVVNQLHNASLILDDIQDQSPLRRGQAATHEVFGVGQSTNTATFMIVETLHKVDLLVRGQAQKIMHTSLRSLFTGQSWDIDWKERNYCPTREQYLEMVTGKTGALFQLISRLIPHPPEEQESLVEKLDRFMNELGLYFQVRDDYRNLKDTSYTAQKGFCEDLDEGKFSYPVVMCCEINYVFKRPLLELFGRLKYRKGGMEFEDKMKVLAMLDKSGAMKATEVAIEAWEEKLMEMVTDLEEAFGSTNPALREILMKLAA
ncbi:FPP/GGPP synthase family protein [Aspergillus aculeatinus CBS 121060]|uniref:Geranylgeranyl pyrophosphate synthase n=1 Tax=Aspergillus aculeatinus CBS 121060 TaxID=1448322 RepID=A0ACD1GVW4_9EURO|nr:putative geranylgeranyl pyrophosphate synthase [Aspergillus aculeatinus CBS 121060]RAH65480.1 putative geranylgeranyl pyrophosphate synthase [Aspergillus aculeatinus CBS 121060]